jgi:hypothetical protein
MEEAQPDAICSRSNGNDGIGRPFCRRIANHEEIVIIVHQLVGGWEPFANRRTHRPDEALVFGRKLRDEALQLSGGFLKGGVGDFILTLPMRVTDFSHEFG